MDYRAYEITPMNVNFLKTITNVSLEVLEANPNWVVFRNPKIDVSWTLMPLNSFKELHPDIHIETP